MRIAKTLMSLLLLVGCLLGQDPQTAGRQDGIAALGQGVYKSMREAEVRKQKKEIQKNLKALEAGNLVECTACAGTGYVKCDGCSGLGYEGCSLCSGQGSVGYGATAVRCTVCNGNGKSMHDPCKGTGREACSRCDGTGNLGEAQKQSSNARAGKAQPQEKRPSSGGGGTATAEDLFLARRYEEAADLAKKKLLFDPKNTELKIIYFYSLLNLGELDEARAFIEKNRQTLDKYITKTLAKMESDIGVYEGIFNVDKLVKESFEKYDPSYMEKAIAVPTLTEFQRLVLKCNLSILKGDFAQAKKECEVIKSLNLKYYSVFMEEINRRETNYLNFINYNSSFYRSVYAVACEPELMIAHVKDNLFETKSFQYTDHKLLNEWVINGNEKQKKIGKAHKEIIKYNLFVFIKNANQLFSLSPFNVEVKNMLIYSLLFNNDVDDFIKISNLFLNVGTIKINCYDDLSFSELSIDKKMKTIKYEKSVDLLPSSFGTFGALKGEGIPLSWILTSKNFSLKFDELQRLEQSAKNTQNNALKRNSYLLKINNNNVVPAFVGMSTIHYQYGPWLQKVATRNLGELIKSVCLPSMVAQLENPEIIEDGKNGFQRFMDGMGEVVSLGVLSSNNATIAQQTQAKLIKDSVDRDRTNSINSINYNQPSIEKKYNITLLGYNNAILGSLDEHALRALAELKFK